MTSTRITVTDTAAGQTATIDPADLADTISPWFVDAPAEVLDAIERLQAALLASDRRDRDPARGLAAYLALDIEEHQ